MIDPTDSRALHHINNWRTSHLYPMNTFSATLRKKLRRYKKKTIVAQRLKRLSTILNKIQRYPDMRLSSMQDIGGIRAILYDINDVYKLRDEYVNGTRLSHRLCREEDYIANPKPDGYRGIHLIYEYNNTLARNGKAKQYKGLFIEIQIRSELQHTWATAVESMGVFLGESFKNGYGNEEWRSFFSLVSSAFAFFENSKENNYSADTNLNEILKEIVRLDKKLHALDQMRTFANVGKDILSENIKRGRSLRKMHYTIISLDLETRTVYIAPYSKDREKEAVKEYEKLEKRGDRYDQVLVSVSSLASLSDAYPNYFLDMNNFLDKITIILEEYLKL